jgi:hypothetical protein
MKITAIRTFLMHAGQPVVATMTGIDMTNQYIKGKALGAAAISVREAM